MKSADFPVQILVGHQAIIGSGFPHTLSSDKMGTMISMRIENWPWRPLHRTRRRLWVMWLRWRRLRASLPGRSAPAGAGSISAGRSGCSGTALSRTCRRYRSLECLRDWDTEKGERYVSINLVTLSICHYRVDLDAMNLGLFKTIFNWQPNSAWADRNLACGRSKAKS